MPLLSRRLRTDEEIGKRNDDYRPKARDSGTVMSASRWARKRRVTLVVVVVLLLYLFIHNIPTDLKPWDQRGGPYNRFGALRKPLGGSSMTFHESQQHSSGSLKGAPPREPDSYDEVSSRHYFNGGIKLYNLASTLRQLTRVGESDAQNRNVLFAFSSLRSASALIPMACEMNKWNRNYVHAAFLGRDDASVEEVLQVNGLDLKSCNIFWHDARPDYGPWSTDERMENSVYAAMRFLDDYIHPKAVLTDDPSREDDFFVRAVRRKFGEVDAPLVELPTDAAERMRWITRMDSSSLAKWHKTTVNILVQAPLESSGSLIRLIESLKAADYRGFTPPRVTVELASSPDPALERYLHQLQSGSLQMAVRRRIANQKMTAEYASIRFMESFYPSEPSFSYVLVLSPQAEVSPLYFHYLMYNVLEYGYSTYRDPSDRTLLGFSLQLPSTYYNDTTLFYPPTVEHTNTGVRSSVKEEYATPFLWQAPNSDACLYDGSKWAELHSFLTFRLRALHEHKDNPRPLKQISKSYPAWTEFFLEFMQARKYSVLYPPPLDSAALVTVHNDLYQPPEEYLHEPETPPVGEKKDSPRVEMGDVEPFTADPSLPSAYSPHSEPTIARVTLTELLPFAGDLPELHELPHLSFAGQALSSSSSSSSSSLHRQNRNMNPLLEDSDSAADAFRVSLGGCTASGLEAERKQKGRRARMKGRGLEARDLFCFEDDELVLDFESGVAAVDGEEEPLTKWPPSATTTTADASTHSHLQSLSSVPLESGA